MGRGAGSQGAQPAHAATSLCPRLAGFLAAEEPPSGPRVPSALPRSERCSRVLVVLVVRQALVAESVA
ncbi:unnamed protein product [Boreogadus saida]